MHKQKLEVTENKRVYTEASKRTWTGVDLGICIVVIAVLIGDALDIDHDQST